MRRFQTGLIVLLLLFGVPGLAQKQFTSVKASVSGETNDRPAYRTSGGPGTNDPGHYFVTHASLAELLRRAYGIADDQIVASCWVFAKMFCPDSGPTAFDIDATMPASTTEPEFAEMLRGLLADRFKLTVHHTTRNVPTFDLTVGPDGPKNTDFTTQVRIMPRLLAPGRSASFEAPNAHRFVMSDRTVAEMLPILANMAGQALAMDRSTGLPRVTDRTGFSGRYTWAVAFAHPRSPLYKDFAPEVMADDPDAGALPSLFEALPVQTGFLLTRTGDVAQDVIVLDHVEQTPRN